MAVTTVTLSRYKKADSLVYGNLHSLCGRCDRLRDILDSHCGNSGGLCDSCLWRTDSLSLLKVRQSQMETLAVTMGVLTVSHYENLAATMET